MFPKRRKVDSEVGETSSAMSKNEYEVFLSFRGQDTRQGFTDCLYHAMLDAGINVFRDDNEIRPGDKLVEVFTAIDNSKLCVVVFSRKFAASAWCLREVERMIGMKKEIVPIFYDVTPDDIKLNTMLYDDALTVHETKYGKEQVQQWRPGTVHEIPSFKGRELKNSGFVEFNRQLVKEILTKLKVKNKCGIRQLVEAPDEVEDALKLLNIESNDRRFLGIHGMGGIGKTTLAKIIFNQISDSFDCSCFLENIRDSLSQGQDDLHKMQKKLLKSLNPLSGDVEKNFKSKKVIIVLDDIDEKSQIHSLVGDSGWFGLGSRIIFTTRKATLHEQAIPTTATFHGLEKKEMSSEQALELFSKHAFGQDSPPKDFKDLSDEVVSVTGGLPLALEVVGSFLCRQKAKVWRSTTNKLKEAPVQDVQRKLRLSFDALEPEQQEIFLDIACFFIGSNKAYPVYMWEACHFYPDHGIQVLISMSLIKVTHEKCFWMHDQIRDFGRAIVNEKSGDLRACSRLWMAKDALNQLRRNLGKEQVEALQVDGFYMSTTRLNREDLVRLKKLRYLTLRSFWAFSGECVRLLPELRWLSVGAFSFNLTSFNLNELVILEFYGCDEVYWQDWSQFLISEKLKVLSICEFTRLASMPDLSKLVNLERLTFSYCDHLTSFHSSLGKLRYLKHLVLQCSNSRRRYYLNLPESIGGLVCLTRLSITNMGFTELPKGIGELVKLKYLSLLRCENLKVIPESLGRLTKLKTLHLSGCSSLHSLPNSVGNLQSLVDLDLNSSGIAQLPNSFGDLASLQKLDLENSGVRSLPGSVRDLKKLQVLHIGDSLYEKWIDEVPELPIGLTMLKIYKAEKIQSLSNLINLSDLEIENKRYLSSDPDSVVIGGIEKLSKLKHLKLECDNLKSLSMELSALQHLKSLKLICPELEFGQCLLPCSLESLELKVKDWGDMLVNLSSLKNLTALDLTHFGGDEIEGTEQEEGYVKSLSVDLSHLKKLKSLRLCCLKLKFREFQFPSSLESLDLNVKQWGKLPANLSSLKNLSVLFLTGFSMEGADEIEGLESLKELWICRSVVKFNCFPVLRSLTYLWLSNCEFSSKCLGMWQLDRLGSLTVLGADGLVEISGIRKETSLSYMDQTLRVSRFRG